MPTMRACAVIPAFDAARTVGEVARAVLSIWPEPSAVWVVDDGSSDGTAKLAREAGARVLVHPANRGKGAALRTGMEAARNEGFEVCVTLDADGQHPAAEALKLVTHEPDRDALVLGIRDLARAGAPRPNQISNGISNFFLSRFTGIFLADTQCGLRRYPLAAELDREARDDGYAFEAEVVLRAVARGIRIIELPIDVLYPPENQRVTHFDSVRDPARIISRVLKTLALIHIPGAPELLRKADSLTGKSTRGRDFRRVS